MRSRSTNRMDPVTVTYEPGRGLKKQGPYLGTGNFQVIVGATVRLYLRENKNANNLISGTQREVIIFIFILLLAYSIQ